jgi:hypothetical protein
MMLGCPANARSASSLYFFHRSRQVAELFVKELQARLFLDTKVLPCAISTAVETRITSVRGFSSQGPMDHKHSEAIKPHNHAEVIACHNRLVVLKDHMISSLLKGKCTLIHLAI